eukprot:Selendium_serpulae@DN8346_c0_g1_i1.p1
MTISMLISRSLWGRISSSAASATKLAVWKSRRSRAIMDSTELRRLFFCRDKKSGTESKERRINDRIDFEWRGSYLMLEREKFIIDCWKSRQYSMNESIGRVEETLHVLATGPAAVALVVERQLKTVPRTVQQTVRVNASIQFEEIYDFEVNLSNWRVVLDSAGGGAAASSAEPDDDDKGDTKELLRIDSQSTNWESTRKPSSASLE